MKCSRIRLITFTIAAILVPLVFYLYFRNVLLQDLVYKRILNINNHHDVTLRFENVYFKGIRTIQFDSLSVVSNPADTMLTIRSLSAGINLRQLITGHIRLRRLTIENAFLHFEQDKMHSYFSFFSLTDKTHRSDSSTTNLYLKVERLLKRAFASIPSKLVLNDFSVIYSLDSVKICGAIDHLLLKNGKFSSSIQLSENEITQTAKIKGTIKPKHRAIELSILPLNEEFMLHSPLAALFGAKASYQSLKVRFVEKEKKGKVLRLEGNCTIGRFEIDQKSLSSKKVTFPGLALIFDIAIGANFIELDSISEIKIGELILHPYLKYSISPSDTVAFSCNIPTFTVNDFYTSLPADLFPHLNIFKAEGNIAYRTKLIVDMKQPDSLLLESKLDADNLKIIHFDNDLFKMNKSFVYTAYNKGKPVRSFNVGTENPDYLPLDEIPVLLQNAILLAEDGSFYSHNGFLLSAIRRAIAENIKIKKFYRGGSTISQQLVKNVYLSSEKTITRKLEEIILVWLIESNHLVSKRRMFEVYLNIIEWGPNVYGAKEAARFYFQKEVRQLNAEECIFLASIIPSPKKFYYRFDKEGQMSPFLIAYYNDMSEKLLQRGLLSSANGDSLSSILKITGPARVYLRSNNTSADSMDEDDLESEY